MLDWDANYLFVDFRIEKKLTKEFVLAEVGLDFYGKLNISGSQLSHFFMYRGRLAVQAP